MSFMFEI